MKTRDEVLKTRPEGRTTDAAKSKSQLRRMEVQQDGGARKDITMKSPKPTKKHLEGYCLYCGKMYSNIDGRVIRCPECGASCGTPDEAS